MEPINLDSITDYNSITHTSLDFGHQVLMQNGATGVVERQAEPNKPTFPTIRGMVFAQVNFLYVLHKGGTNHFRPYWS